MKSAATATVDTITNGYVNTVAVIVHAEWENNRFYRALVDNTPSEDTDGFDIEMFPIESIAKQNRPKSGINKAIVNQATVENGNHSSVPAARYYLASPEDSYKYWQSPVPSGAAAPYAITNCAPQVIYVEENTDTGIVVDANKITYTVERTWAHPVNYNVQVRSTPGGAWTTVASNIAVPASGQIELWYDGAGWTQNKTLGFSTTLNGVRLVVNTMSREGYFNLIELGTSLVLDLSRDVITTSDSFTMGEVDFITPLGNISSNSGQVVLMNEHARYTNTNEESILNGLLDRGVKFTCWMGYGSDNVQEYELFADVWTEEDDQTVVTLVDNTKFFMDTKPPVVLYQNIPVQEAVWRICDIIGFTDYEVNTLDTSEQAIIDTFWTDGEKTAWETFSELARGTQTAIFFDAYGKLQVRTRDAAWDDNQTVKYTFTRETVNGVPSNIVSLTDQTDYEANKVAVNWQPTGFSERKDNIVPFEVVWEPEGDVVLRASELAESITASDMIIPLSRKDGSTWPPKGVMNIEGEWISYEGKEYVHYSGGNRQKTWVTSYEQQRKIDDNTPGSKTHLNNYTGRLQVKERGLYNTEAKAHTIDLSGWSKARQRDYGSANNASGIVLNKGKSTVTISAPKNSDMKDYTYLHRGSAANQGYWYLGTRLRVDKSAHSDKCGGIFFNVDGGLGTGYYVEVTATAMFDGKRRANGNEIMFYSMKADGSKKHFGGERIKMKDKSKNHKKDAKVKTGMGEEKAVPMGDWLDLDIKFDVRGNGDHEIQIWCDGGHLFTAVVPNASGWQHDRVERFGLYARGHSSLTYEYVYAIVNKGDEPSDSEPYFDRILGGYYSTQAADWTFGTRDKRRKVKRKWTKYKQRYNQRFFDDFGAWCHEIREFDVKFTSDLPSLQSKLYFSNTTQAVAMDYWASPKEAHFTLANTSRVNAIISGDDELTAQGNGTINHKLFVYGRPVIQKDTQTVERTDEWALRRRGVIEVEYDSPWIQNEAEANRFAEWLTTHWSRSDTSLSVEVWGNPLIELGDMVHVNWKDIDDDFYVVAVNNAFESGLSTTLDLRKVTHTA